MAEQTKPNDDDFEILNPADDAQHEFYMRQALRVAKKALDIGEVPVGCVIVMHDDDHKSYDRHVIVSHGANQVNMTRDATRHAEMVAIDRMLTKGAFSDALRLPLAIITRSAHGKVPLDSPLLLQRGDKQQEELWQDRLVTETNDREVYGWGSGRTYSVDVFSKCDLYVTCEPCIMCAAALARVNVRRVFFGCRNDRFGGCGSLMNLHESTKGAYYEIHGGILAEEAISLLRSFYDRENFHAPDDKRKRKGEPSKNQDGS